MKPPQFEYRKANSISDALKKGQGEIKFLGGGQSLGPMLNLRLARPEVLVDLHRIDELKSVHENHESVLYGAGITHAEFEDGVVIDAANGMLQHVARDIAYRAIRHRGTLGGSLAHADPAADWVNVMIAIDATIQIANAKKVRQVAAHEFFHGAFMTALQPNEIISAVSVPRLSNQARWGYYKFCRKQGEFSDATGVAVVDPVRAYARVVAGALDGPPKTLETVADVLAESGIDTALEQVRPSIDKLLPGYETTRRELLAVAVSRAVLQLKGTSSEY